MMRDAFRALSQVLLFPAIACWFMAILGIFYVVKNAFSGEWAKGLKEFKESLGIPLVFAASFLCMIFDTEEKGIAGARVLLFLLGVLYVASMVFTLGHSNWMLISTLVIGAVSMFYSAFAPAPPTKKKNSEDLEDLEEKSR